MKERYRLFLRRKSVYYAFDNTTKTFERGVSSPLPFCFPLASRTSRSTIRIALSNQTGSRLSRYLEKICPELQGAVLVIHTKNDGEISEASSGKNNQRTTACVQMYSGRSSDGFRSPASTWPQSGILFATVSQNSSACASFFS